MMARALGLAARGAGQVSPGPLVGCVDVDKRGEVAGEGCYVYERLQPAETLAPEQAGERERGGTACVTLGPDAHARRAPPDPRAPVCGRGFAELREAGVEVTVGVLAREASRQNEKYIRAVRDGRPFVHLKLACSLDGRIATSTGHARWISSEQSRARVHLLRREADAVLVGAGTAAVDDPLLTDRSGLPRRRPLLR